MISGMGSIMHIAHISISDIFTGPVEITEKVDGSFISFAMTEEDGLQMRSKGQELHWDAPSSKMFQTGMESIKDQADKLVPGWIYRGEYLAKPKHNSLAYDRIPTGHIVLFDIELDRPGEHAPKPLRDMEAGKLGFDSVPVLFDGVWDKGLQELKSFFDTVSFLGGQNIEGVVVKNYSQFLHGHIQMGKLVSEVFKEVHKKEWKVGNPGGKDIIETIIDSHRTPARWNKAIQHLRDDGTLTNSPRDIGPLLKEVSVDIHKEEADAIKEMLFKWAWPQVSRGVCRGLPEFYKEKLISDDDNEKEDI